MEECLTCDISLNDFLNLEDEELACLIKAHNRKLHREAHLFGAYFYEALNDALALLSGKKHIHYPSMSYLEEKDMNDKALKLSPLDKDILYRNALNNWL